ncbi:MAG: carboxylating nicotinate-nucleotide diphosphorylase [Spirochaetes bacterium]|nr:carboxylating nicotinate-nucleotide diphosphorylase [Spirochaetota bacterium]
MKIKKETYINIIRNSLKEDLQNIGDITSEPIFKEDKNATFVLLSKDYGILCGKDIFCDVFNYIDKKCNVEFYFEDRDVLKKSDIVARVKGRVVSILKGERTALNFISHLSGIATKTSIFVEEANRKIKILDTRKTMPGIRALQKYAVNCGGGYNHRMGLYDMVLIKDNHIDAVGGIANAVAKIRNRWKNKYKIEVETRNLDEVKEALLCNVDRIMLDNMSIDKMKEAVGVINNKVEVEASGNVTFDKIKDIANTGVDFVSIGELTHTVKAFDFSLNKE